MSHCRTSHQTGHQPHARATLKPKSQIHQLMGDLKHQLGHCAPPLQKQQKKGARKCIHHLIPFLARLFEHCCSCAQGVIHQRGPESTSGSLPAASHWLHRMRSENSHTLQKMTQDDTPDFPLVRPVNLRSWCDTAIATASLSTPGRRTAWY